MSTHDFALCKSPKMWHLDGYLTAETNKSMTTPLPPLQLDGHQEKASSIWQCICIKSTCCSTTHDDEEQNATINVDVNDTQKKTCCVATRCCIIS